MDLYSSSDDLEESSDNRINSPLTSDDTADIKNLRDQFQQQETLLEQLKGVLQSNERKLQLKKAVVKRYASRLSKSKFRKRIGRDSVTSSQTNEIVNTICRDGNLVENTGSKKIKLLREELQAARTKQSLEFEARRELQNLVDDLKAELDRRDELISSLQDDKFSLAGTLSPPCESVSGSTYSPFIMSPEGQRSPFGMEQSIDQDDLDQEKVEDLKEQIFHLERHVSDVEENLEIKENVIRSRDETIEILKSKLCVLGQEDFEHLQKSMTEMQQNFLEKETNWKIEKLRLQTDLMFNSDRIQVFQQESERLTNLESNLQNKCRDLQAKVASMEREACETKTKFSLEKSLLEQQNKELLATVSRLEKTVALQKLCSSAEEISLDTLDEPETKIAKLMEEKEVLETNIVALQDICDVEKGLKENALLNYRNVQELNNILNIRILDYKQNLVEKEELQNELFLRNGELSDLAAQLKLQIESNEKLIRTNLNREIEAAFHHQKVECLKFENRSEKDNRKKLDSNIADLEMSLFNVRNERDLLLDEVDQSKKVRATYEHRLSELERSLVEKMRINQSRCLELENLQSVLGQKNSEISSQIVAIEVLKDNLDKKNVLIDQLKKDLATAQEELDKIRHGMEENIVHSQLNKLKEDHDQLQAQYDALDRSFHELRTEKEAIQRCFQEQTDLRLEETVCKLNAEIHHTLNDLSNEKQKVYNLTEELQDIKNKHVMNQATIDGQLKSLSNELETFKDEKLQFSNEINLKSDIILQLENKLSHLNEGQSVFDDQCLRINELSTELSNAVSQNQALSDDLKAKTIRIDGLLADLDSVMCQKEALSDELNSNSGRIDGLSADLEGVMRQKEALLEELKFKSGRIDELSANLEGVTCQKETLLEQVSYKSAKILQLEAELKRTMDQQAELDLQSKNLSLMSTELHHIKCQKEALESEIVLKSENILDLNERLVQKSEQLDKLMIDLDAVLYEKEMLSAEISSKSEIILDLENKFKNDNEQNSGFGRESEDLCSNLDKTKCDKEESFTETILELRIKISSLENKLLAYECEKCKILTSNELLESETSSRIQGLLAEQQRYKNKLEESSLRIAALELKLHQIGASLDSNEEDLLAKKYDDKVNHLEELLVTRLEEINQLSEINKKLIEDLGILKTEKKNELSDGDAMSVVDVNKLKAKNEMLTERLKKTIAKFKQQELLLNDSHQVNESLTVKLRDCESAFDSIKINLEEMSRQKADLENGISAMRDKNEIDIAFLKEKIERQAINSDILKDVASHQTSTKGFGIGESEESLRMKEVEDVWCDEEWGSGWEDTLHLSEQNHDNVLKGKPDVLPVTNIDCKSICANCEELQVQISTLVKKVSNKEAIIEDIKLDVENQRLAVNQMSSLAKVHEKTVEDINVKLLAANEYEKKATVEIGDMKGVLEAKEIMIDQLKDDLILKEKQLNLCYERNSEWENKVSTLKYEIENQRSEHELLLERLKSEQEQLISLKESEMAQLFKQLSDSEANELLIQGDYQNCEEKLAKCKQDMLDELAFKEKILSELKMQLDESTANNVILSGKYDVAVQEKLDSKFLMETENERLSMERNELLEQLSDLERKYTDEIRVLREGLNNVRCDYKTLTEKSNVINQEKIELKSLMETEINGLTMEMSDLLARISKLKSEHADEIAALSNAENDKIVGGIAGSQDDTHFECKQDLLFEISNKEILISDLEKRIDELTVANETLNKNYSMVIQESLDSKSLMETEISGLTMEKSDLLTKISELKREHVDEIAALRNAGNDKVVDLSVSQIMDGISDAINNVPRAEDSDTIFVWNDAFEKVDVNLFDALSESNKTEKDTKPNEVNYSYHELSQKYQEICAQLEELSKAKTLLEFEYGQARKVAINLESERETLLAEISALETKYKNSQIVAENKQIEFDARMKCIKEEHSTLVASLTSKLDNPVLTPNLNKENMDESSNHLKNFTDEDKEANIGQPHFYLEQLATYQEAINEWQGWAEHKTAEMESLQASLTQYYEAYESSCLELTRLNSELTEKEETIVNLRSSSKAKSIEIEDLCETSERLRSDKLELDEEIKNMSANLDNLRHRLEHSEDRERDSELDDIKSLMAEIRNEKTVACKEASFLRLELSQAKAEVSELDYRIKEEFEPKIVQAKVENDRITLAYDKLLKKEFVLKSEIERITFEYDKLLKVESDLKAEIERITFNYDKLLKVEFDLKAEIERKNIEYDNLLKVEFDLKDKIEHITFDYDKLLKVEFDLKVEVERLTLDYDKLLKIKSDLEAEIENLKTSECPELESTKASLAECNKVLQEWYIFGETKTREYDTLLEAYNNIQVELKEAYSRIAQESLKFEDTVSQKVNYIEQLSALNATNEKEVEILREKLIAADASNVDLAQDLKLTKVKHGKLSLKLKRLNQDENEKLTLQDRIATLQSTLADVSSQNQLLLRVSTDYESLKLKFDELVSKNQSYQERNETLHEMNLNLETEVHSLRISNHFHTQEQANIAKQSFGFESISTKVEENSEIDQSDISREALNDSFYDSENLNSENGRLRLDLDQSTRENRLLNRQLTNWRQEFSREGENNLESIKCSRALKLRVEELSLEVTKLLEERDTLQLKLSNVMRRYERHRDVSTCSTPVPWSTDDLDLCDVQQLRSKIEELGKLNYALDVELQNERTQRNEKHFNYNSPSSVSEPSGVLHL